MDVGVLGPLEVRTDDGTVAVAGARQRALLAALVAHRGRTVGVDVLVDTLWPDDPPPSAAHTLHTHVSRLRRTLEVPVHAHDGGYVLDLADGQVDAALFEAWLAEAERADAVTAVTLTESALGLWRGPAFGGAADLPGVRAEARRLEERRTAARRALVDHLVAAGRGGDAVPLAEALVADVPIDERAWAGLVRALVAAGRPADGTTAFGRAVAALDELGLVPSAGLRRAHDEALGVRAAALGVRPAAPTSAPADTSGTVAAARPTGARRGPAATTVPVPPTSLVGRDDDLADLRLLLGAARLVTLVGPGGVGKTRLALELARRVADGFTSGVRVVELGTVRDAAALPAAALAPLGLGAEAGPATTALRRLGDLDVLVLVDNGEHLLDAAAALVEGVLAGARARVVVTSRERLGVPGEHVHVVAPLATAATPSGPAARRLFLDRAGAAGPVDATLDVTLVDRVVQALDGLPLAIEMAAARTATVSLAELAAMLADDPRAPASPGAGAAAAAADGTDAVLGPADGAAALRHPHRTGPERHRSLGSVIAWSEALLDPAEREALHRWPVFAGPVEASDAAAVVGAGRGTVEALVRRSLLLPQPGDPQHPAPRTRYRMLHTVRAAVLAGPDRRPLPHEAHARHVGEVAAACDAALRGPGEAAAAARLRSVVAELRAAHAWAREHAPGVASGLSTSLHVFAVVTLDDEVLGWAQRLVPRLAGDDPAVAAAHAGVAARLLQAGELRAAEVRAERALALAVDDRVRMQAHEVLSDAAIYDGRLAECRAQAARLWEFALAAGDGHYAAIAAASTSLALAYAGDRPAAHAELARHRALLDASVPDLSSTALGWFAYAEGELDLDADPDRAARSLGRAVALADSVGDRYLGGVARVSATSVRGRHGEPREALVAFEDVVGWWLERGDRTHLLTTLRNLVDLLRRLDAPEAAAELLGAVAGADVSPTFGAEGERLALARDELASALGDTRLTGLLRTGAARDVESAARAALEAARRLRDA
ncbi:BTAD domain-containing putative transcriptional regulator [Cellulomonas cellasea]|uniref:Putative ATPase/DNA-binding SARP family transcriptional activator n=1 Tax=Cellulomonas cellasea TaxID=43670 RepID=A0A7W4YAV5_9CELL|nr:BTAD domain-containing putative transcriptional regulator [Cellulomonas cellasea]MBB2922147.1 putative ATPase/DNA-binding SARP family transcriptional activator [Cellulomonas cellasea]